MKRPEGDLVLGCVDRLRELPFVDEAIFVREAEAGNVRADGLLRVVTPGEFLNFDSVSKLVRRIADS